MRAARLNETPNGVRLLLETEVDRPEFGPMDVLIRVHACGINQVDLLTEAQQTPQQVDYPHTSGTEVAGDIVEVGADVTGWHVGDRVVVDPVITCGDCTYCINGRNNLCLRGRIYGVQTQGGYAEFAAVPARQLLMIPENMSHHQAAAIAVTGPTAWHMLHRRAALMAGEDVLVIAAGSGIGVIAVQIAKLSGARVIATAGGPEKVQKARELGVDFVVDHNDPNWPTLVREFTGRRGVDVVFEHVGKATWDGSISSMARGARLVTSGGHSGFDVNINLWHLFIKELVIIGSYAGSRQDFIDSMGLAGRGLIVPVIQETFPLERAADALSLLRGRKVFGKLLLDPTLVDAVLLDPTLPAPTLVQA